MRWDPSFFRKSSLFWPITPAASRLAHFTEWPRPEELTAALAPHAAAEVPVRFELAAPKPRRRSAHAAPTPAGYDARIALERVVPTRAQSWHDLLNALVWATFPRAKLALHERQHRMISARLGEDPRLPSARTREQDAVAMIDEGGVALLCGPHGSCAIVFGHAIYEGLACGGPPNVRGAAYSIAVADIPRDPPSRIVAADDALAGLLAREAPVGREDFETLVVSEELGP